MTSFFYSNPYTDLLENNQCPVCKMPTIKIKLYTWYAPVPLPAVYSHFYDEPYWCKTCVSGSVKPDTNWIKKKQEAEQYIKWMNSPLIKLPKKWTFKTTLNVLKQCIELFIICFILTLCLILVFNIETIVLYLDKILTMIIDDIIDIIMVNVFLPLNIIQNK